MVEVVPEGSVPEGAPFDRTGEVLSTMIEMAVDVARFPAASRATAVIVCEPSETVVEFQTILYGAVVSSAAMSVLVSSLNCTPTTPTASKAEADITTAVLEAKAPFEGAVTDTEGAIVSGAAEVVNVALAPVCILPEASRAKIR